MKNREDTLGPNQMCKKTIKKLDEIMNQAYVDREF